MFITNSFCVVLHLGLLLVLCTAKPSSDLCASNAKCGECLRTAGCFWCLATDWNADAPRCIPENATTVCSQPYTVKSSHASTAAASGVLSVKRVKVNLRINVKHRIDITFTQPLNSPLDLYYLMDLSYSMSDDKYKLESLAESLGRAIGNITADFRLGFGSFVEKALRPYSDKHASREVYSYRHHLSLTTETQKFSELVRQATVTGNWDTPEAGFDGLVQALVCDHLIGWRASSRRLIIFATDAGFHSAGDGKLGGLIAPNDGKCHLDASGYYTETLHQDYPSVSQINHLARNHSVNIIFAATADNTKVYDGLSKRVEGSSSSVLSSDSSNIVQLVVKEYKSIRSTVEMKDNAPSSIHVAYYTHCNHQHARLVQTNKCQNVTNGEQVVFQVELTAVECPRDSTNETIIQIYPVGFKKHTMEVVVKLLCECECERVIDKGPSYRCNGHGFLKCGLCDCEEKYLGKTCQCSKDDVQNMRRYEQNCIKGDDTLPCSGHGTCFCGQCDCNARPDPLEVFSGPYCECDNFSCERRNGVLCSGNGACTCGRCECNPNFNGTACDCSVATDNCLAADGSTCSGHGECMCNECVCHKPTGNEGRYTGALCQHCPTCPSDCNSLKNCVMCHMYGKGPLAESDLMCENNCNHIQFNAVESLDDSVGSQENPTCVFYEENNCKFKFSYANVEKSVSGVSIEVTAQKRMYCKSVFYILIVVFTVVAAIVLVGLVSMLVWKLLTNIRDELEFARFVKDSGMAKWDAGGNPIFKEATSRYQNPIFRKSLRFLGKSDK